MNEPTFHYPTPEGERIITTAPMSLERAREILEGLPFPKEIESDGSILFIGKHGDRLDWQPSLSHAVLTGSFTADQLEALAVWMRAHAK